MDPFFASFLSLINLISVIVCISYAKKIYDSTSGAADYWLFLCAFIFSLGGFIMFDFIINFTPLTFVSPLIAAEDISLAFSAIFAFVSVIYLRRMFKEMIGEKV